MPERWERELQKLRGVDVREPVVRQRVERGPSGHRPPTRRDRLAAGIVAASVFLAAGAFAWRALGPGGGEVPFGSGSWPVATVSFNTSAAGERLATLDVGGSEQEGLTGASTSPNDHYPYSWLPPDRLDDLSQPLEVPMGSELALDGDVAIKELLYGDAEQLDAGAGPDSGPIWADQPVFSEPYFLPWDEKPERTYLKFFGTWADGQVLDVYFEVVFAAPDVDLTDPGAEIVVTPEPMGAAFLYGGQRAPIGVQGGTYGNMSITSDFAGFDERAIVAKVPAGTPFEIGGEDLVDASVRAGSLPLGERGTPLDGAVPTETGRYVLTMEITWGGGSATFLHQIEVVPELTTGPSPTPAPSSLGSIAIGIRRSSSEAGDPEAIAQFGTREQWMCPDGWNLVNPDGTTDNAVFDCGQNDAFEAPPGTPITVSGDFASLEATARLSAPGDLPRYAPDEVPTIDPGSVVFFQYAVEWDDGSTASFWLLLTVGTALEEPAPSLDPGTEAASALRVRCEPYGADVQTPVVATQADGVHIVPVDTPSDWEILLFHADEPQAWAAGSNNTDDEFVRPMSEGEASVACIDHREFTDLDMKRAESAAVPFLVTDEAGWFTPYWPECAPSQQRDRHWRMDGVVIDDAADRLRSIAGVREGDVIELAGYDVEWGSRRVWRIVRDGRIVAGLWVGNQGGGSVNGFVCLDSGIEGDQESSS